MTEELDTKFYDQLTNKIVDVVKTKLGDDSTFTIDTRIRLLPFGSLKDMTEISEFVGLTTLAKHPKLMAALAKDEDVSEACWDVLESSYEGQYTFGQGNDNDEYNNFLSDVEEYISSK